MFFGSSPSRASSASSGTWIAPFACSVAKAAAERTSSSTASPASTLGFSSSAVIRGGSAAKAGAANVAAIVSRVLRFMRSIVPH